jgi:hypothetical protein
MEEVALQVLRQPELLELQVEEEGWRWVTLWATRKNNGNEPVDY